MKQKLSHDGVGKTGRLGMATPRSPSPDDGGCRQEDQIRRRRLGGIGLMGNGQGKFWPANGWVATRGNRPNMAVTLGARNAVDRA